jgi:exopolyphosphatase/guanosine-5'-triphosphate,3'-diphosphate pyrophosphatase
MKSPEGHSALRVASLDIGTNSVRLLVADVSRRDGGFQRVYLDRRITRLGEGMQRSGGIKEEAMARTLEALSVFLVEAERRGARRILATGTSAVRESINRDLLLARARDDLGLDIHILSGEEEAHWMMRGVALLWPQISGHWMIVDVGGGSTEFVAVKDARIESSTSIPLGMVRLTEGVFQHDPPLAAELVRCRKTAREEFAKALDEIKADGDLPRLLIGTAGTVTTLAALDLKLAPYDADRVNGHRLSREGINAWCDLLSELNARERRELPGMESGREDVIVAGALMFSELLDLLHLETVHVSDYGLLEGIAAMAATNPFFRNQTTISDGAEGEKNA